MEGRECVSQIDTRIEPHCEPKFVHDRIIPCLYKELFEGHEYLSWHLIFALLNIAVIYAFGLASLLLKCKFKCKFIDMYVSTIFLHKNNNRGAIDN